MASTTDFPPFGITICGIPEIEAHSAAGITHILSIHDPDLADPPEFAGFPRHRRLSLRFHDIIEPQPQQVAPSAEDVERLLEFGAELGGAPNDHLLIHCHAGVSRSTAAAALILAQAAPERPAREVFAAIVRMRPRAWPNLRMLEFGDEILGRGGEIVAAVPAVYRNLLDRRPELEEAMIVGGRLREVMAAIASPPA
ncbi:MAG TPA: protein-tyrosine-phosphatase [Stellaceae bacterium]|jgi:predicted protein tyrosine phosphatase|nr:protein-tyrosine-phosphatase [Stellaceae bacterium]